MNNKTNSDSKRKKQNLWITIGIVIAILVIVLIAVFQVVGNKQKSQNQNEHSESSEAGNDADFAPATDLSGADIENVPQLVKDALIEFLTVNTAEDQVTRSTRISKYLATNSEAYSQSPEDIMTLDTVVSITPTLYKYENSTVNNPEWSEIVDEYAWLYAVVALSVNRSNSTNEVIYQVWNVKATKDYNNRWSISEFEKMPDGNAQYILSNITDGGQ